jgi:GNAT superfamily N-acetyltransferase
MGFAVREMVSGDCEKVVDFCQRHDPAAPRPETLRDQLSQCQRRWPGLSLLAFRDGRLVGVLLCTRRAPADRLHRLVVDPDAADADLGRELIDRALGKLESRGVACCRLQWGGGDLAAQLVDSRRWEPACDRETADSPPPDPAASDPEADQTAPTAA